MADGSPANSFFAAKRTTIRSRPNTWPTSIGTGDSRQAHNVLGVFEVRSRVVKDPSVLRAELALLRQFEGQGEDVLADDLEQAIGSYEPAIKSPISP